MLAKRIGHADQECPELFRRGAALYGGMSEFGDAQAGDVFGSNTALLKDQCAVSNAELFDSLRADELSERIHEITEADFCSLRMSKPTIASTELSGTHRFVPRFGVEQGLTSKWSWDSLSDCWGAWKEVVKVRAVDNLSWSASGPHGVKRTRAEVKAQSINGFSTSGVKVVHDHLDELQSAMRYFKNKVGEVRFCSPFGHVHAPMLVLLISRYPIYGRRTLTVPFVACQSWTSIVGPPALPTNIKGKYGHLFILECRSVQLPP